MQEPEQVHNQQKKFEVLLTSDQMKKLQKLLPTGCSFVSAQKNQKSSKKSSSRSNLFTKKYDHEFNNKQSRRKHVISDNLARNDADINTRRCQKILQLLKQNHNSSPFIYPVVPEQLGIPNYFNIIKHPMDIQTVDNKLKSGEYLVEQDFVSDLDLIWNNATLFNDASTDVHQMALNMKSECDRLLTLPNEKLFQKKEKTTKDYSKAKRSIADKPLNFQEQKNLSNNIKLLPQSCLYGIMDIVQQGQQSSGEGQKLEFNIAQLDAKRARDLERFVNKKLEEHNIKKKVNQIQKIRKTVQPVQQEPIYQQPPTMNYTSQPEQMPLIDQAPLMKEPKKHLEPDDSSHSSFISDLESDEDQLVQQTLQFQINLFPLIVLNIMMNNEYNISDQDDENQTNLKVINLQGQLELLKIQLAILKQKESMQQKDKCFKEMNDLIYQCEFITKRIINKTIDIDIKIHEQIRDINQKQLEVNITEKRTGILLKKIENLMKQKKLKSLDFSKIILNLPKQIIQFKLHLVYYYNKKNLLKFKLQMGNTQCRDAEEFQRNYIHLGRKKDPRYDTVDFYQNRNNLKDFIMVKDRWTNSQQESQEINALIENRKSIYHPNLAVCQEYNQENQKQFFNNFYKHNMGFEYYDHNLDKLNQQRAMSGIQESEEMMWYTADSLVDADVSLNREGDAYHGDLQPSTVMLTDQSSTPDVKTIDSTLVHLNKGTYDRMLFDRNVKAAVSPEVCSQLEQKKVKPIFEPTKQESWSLGMTMLCQANNTTLDDYYDWKVPRVRYDAVQDGLDNIDRNYSNQLHGFVQDCLYESESDRRSMEDHDAWLKKYRNQAKEKKLNFQKQVKVQSTPPPPPIRKPDYTQKVDGDDDFFNQNIQIPQQQQTTIKFTGGGFFDVQEQILEDEQGNFFD